MFDSGVGGLSVLNALRRALPHESFVYLGDTARLPYGPKPSAMVRGFASEIAGELVGRGVKGVVIACNTASAAALPDLADSLPVPTWGVVEPGVTAALKAAPGGRIGVLGTALTVASRVYQGRLEAAGATTWARPCPLFVPIVEEGVADSPIARLVAAHYLEERPPLDAVILGCTHYPALKPVLGELLGPGVKLVDSAEAVADVVKGGLASAGLLAAPAGPKSVHYVVTGDVGAFAHAARTMGAPDGTFEHLPVSELAGAAGALK